MKGWLKTCFIIALGLLVGGVPGMAAASAWGPDKGATELIVTAERVSADKGYDASGDKAVYLGTWEEKRVTVFAEHGIHARLSVFAKANLQDIQTVSDKFSGLGSLEIGIKTPLYTGKSTALSASLSIEGLGKGRRDEFSTPGTSDPDIEARIYGGYSFDVGKTPVFVDAQVARRTRSGANADQWRVDVTVGARPTDKWIVLGQVFAGQTDRLQGFRARWAHLQVSGVRFFDAKQTLGVQVGLRQTVSGENVPQSKAVMIGLWKRF